jgi:hypothetical protein
MCFLHRFCKGAIVCNLVAFGLVAPTAKHLQIIENQSQFWEFTARLDVVNVSVSRVLWGRPAFHALSPVLTDNITP